jgi:hypothetical protein
LLTSGKHIKIFGWEKHYFTKPNRRNISPILSFILWRRVHFNVENLIISCLWTLVRGWRPCTPTGCPIPTSPPAPASLTSKLIHCKENSIYVFLFWELRGLSPNFHIHVSVSDLYIPIIGPHISCSRTGRPILEYITFSQTNECRN